jgi:hypothetical protein
VLVWFPPSPGTTAPQEGREVNGHDSAPLDLKSQPQEITIRPMYDGALIRIDIRVQEGALVDAMTPMFERFDVCGGFPMEGIGKVTGFFQPEDVWRVLATLDELADSAYLLLAVPSELASAR